MFILLVVGLRLMSLVLLLVSALRGEDIVLCFGVLQVVAILEVK